MKIAYLLYEKKIFHIKIKKEEFYKENKFIISKIAD